MLMETHAESGALVSQKLAKFCSHTTRDIMVAIVYPDAYDLASIMLRTQIARSDSTKCF